MKKIITYIVFSYLPFAAFAQFNTSIGLVTSLDYTKVSNAFLFSEEGTMNLRFGGDFSFRIFENISMKTGVRFAQLGTVIRMDDLRWPSEFGPNGWVPDPSLPRYQHTTTKNRYIEVPLLGRFEFGHKRVSYYLELGISPHLYINTAVTSESNLESSTTVIDNIANGENRILLGYVMGIGLDYYITSKMQLFAQPTLRLYSRPSSPNGFRSFGFEIGIRRGISFVDKE